MAYVDETGLAEVTTKLKTYIDSKAGGGSGSMDGHKVEFRDIDGSLLAPVQYVPTGGSATIPKTNPSYDSNYLEFVEWQTSASEPLNNVQREILAMPYYRTKYDENLGQRPTYLTCFFDNDTLSPTLQIGTTHVNTFVDWGDGSDPEEVTANTIAHTYAAQGLYMITVYGDTYSVGGSMLAGVFTTSAYQNALLKAYMGENCRLNSGYTFCNALSLNVVVLSSGFNTSAVPSMFNNCRSLKYVLIPLGISTISPNAFRGCYGLKSVVIPNSVTLMSDASIYNCYALDSIALPILPSGFGSNVFYSCYAITSLTIPSDWDVESLRVHGQLSNNSLIDIAINLKDRSETTAKTINFNKNSYYARLNTIYVDTNGEEVDYGTIGAKSLLQFITDKNWTVAFFTE